MEIVERVDNYLKDVSVHCFAFHFECEMKEAFKKHKITSPIEQMFFVAWTACARLGHFIGDRKLFIGDYFLEISPQWPIGKYRADFHIINTPYVIELDGHVWHEKNPEQVRLDKERERFFIRQGYIVMRFSGREVYENPSKCAFEAYIDILISERKKNKKQKGATK